MSALLRIARYNLSFLLLIPLSLKAQIDIGIGPQLDFPLMYNNAVGDYHHTLGAFGPRTTISYISPNTSFYPSLSINGSEIFLPLLKIGGTAINMRFLEATITLSAKLRKQLNKGELHYGLGISAVYLDGQDIKLTGQKDNIISIATDSSFITTWMPAVNLNVEYMIPMSSHKPWFAGFGFNLQYIHFFDRGIQYNVQILDDQYNFGTYHPKLQGNVFNPGVYVTFYYRFGQRDYY